VFDALSNEILARKRELGAAGANKKAREQLQKAWKTFDGKIGIIFGKEVFSILSAWTQEEFKVSISPLFVTRHMKSGDIPEELVRVIDAIQNVESLK